MAPTKSLTPVKSDSTDDWSPEVVTRVIRADGSGVAPLKGVEEILWGAGGPAGAQIQEHDAVGGVGAYLITDGDGTLQVHGRTPELGTPHLTHRFVVEGDGFLVGDVRAGEDWGDAFIHESLDGVVLPEQIHAEIFEPPHVDLIIHVTGEIDVVGLHLEGQGNEQWVRSGLGFVHDVGIQSQVMERAR